MHSDLRYAWRAMWKSPSTTIGAILALALGIGATTTIFGLLNAVLLRPLPYPDADRLVEIWGNVQRQTRRAPRRVGARLLRLARSDDVVRRDGGVEQRELHRLRRRRARARQLGDRRRPVLRAARRPADARPPVSGRRFSAQRAARGRDRRTPVGAALQSRRRRDRPRASPRRARLHRRRRRPRALPRTFGSGGAVDAVRGHVLAGISRRPRQPLVPRARADQAGRDACRRASRHHRRVARGSSRAIATPTTNDRRRCRRSRQKSSRPCGPPCSCCLAPSRSCC